ncbi:MAG: DNA-binding protein [Porticoccaceae bacterium]|jgi:uncharacterized OB-fold protein|nr:DNA-binding protein [Porticoccaceae bacterium]MBT3797568.1 DNA-binding protein [Porticoccaceae bacterium]MBT4165136.1 DNA-binding protein [Porticoccaceae bacterium]MBT4210617.1 DNA-binding protein [Porticoccaceae bacterium]MBT4592068.1 DNA-binding protein [Porticoccaceae bacterium]
MTKNLQPIASGLWSDEAQPHLLAGQSTDGRIFFPIPEGDSGKNLEVIKLSRTGTLWSFTRQDFKPKPPYDGPEEFSPFLLGYVELPGEIIVESYIIGTTLEELKIGMALEFVITPFDEKRSTYAFRPEQTL